MAVTVREGGAQAPLDPDGLDALIDRLVERQLRELHGIRLNYREVKILGERSRSCRCDRSWEFAQGHCTRCGHDVALEQIGDEAYPYFVDDPDRCAFPDDGRMEAEL